MQIMLNVSTARMKLQNAPGTQKILLSAERAVKRAKGQYVPNAVSSNGSHQ